MKLRPEVVEGIAAAKWSLGAGAEDEPYLLALVELGVRLGIANCCDTACTPEDISADTVREVLEVRRSVELEVVPSMWGPEDLVRCGCGHFRGYHLYTFPGAKECLVGGCGCASFPDILQAQPVATESTE